MTFVPHGILLALAYLWSQGVHVPFAEQVAIATVAALPFWSMWTNRRHSLGRGLLLGPGTAVVVATALLVWWAQGPIGDLGWIFIVMATAAILAFTVYSLLVYAVAGWVRRRRARGKMLG